MRYVFYFFLVACVCNHISGVRRELVKVNDHLDRIEMSRHLCEP